MNELIAIHVEGNGEARVSARDLYERLGMSRANWSKWYKANIEQNPFAAEGPDWRGFILWTNGNETKDFMLSLDFAKKLCMMAKTETGERIRDYFIAQERRASQLAPTLPYHLRRHMANSHAIPHTHFSILAELTIRLIGPLEAIGYTLPERLLPDISEGRMFCKYLRDEKGIDTDALPTYRHEFEDGRVVYPKMYPVEIYADFVRHFHEKWMPERAEAYFMEKDRSAVPYLRQHFQQLPASTIRVDARLTNPDEDE